MNCWQSEKAVPDNKREELRRGVIDGVEGGAEVEEDGGGCHW